MQMLIQLIYRKDKWISPAIRELIKLSMCMGSDECESNAK